MKKLQATNDKNAYALVDDDVFETIQEMGLKFYVNNNGYFQSTSHMIKLPGMTEKKQLQLHVFVWILNTGEKPSSEVDHVDIDKSNNMFSNLRLATRQEQQQHQGRQKNNKSGFIGISHEHDVHKRNKKNNVYDYWRASILRPDGHSEVKTFPFTDEGKIAAARWRDQKAIDYFGDFCGELNFPDDNK